MGRNINSDSNELRKKWMPRQEVQEFFGYGNTQMSTFHKDNDVEMAKVGRKVFYSTQGILNLLDRSKAGPKLLDD